MLNYFISFLNRQFELCEDSVYCNQDLMKGLLPGFKPFVIAFMIEMSKVIIFVHLYRYHHNARLYYEFVTMHGMSNMYNTKGNKLLSA